MAGYERWRALAIEAGFENTLMLPLAPSAITGKGNHQGLFKRRNGVSGRAAIDLVDGQITVDAAHLPTNEPYDVWLIDNQPGPEKVSKKPHAWQSVVPSGES
ncbi:hypothetical protein C2W62_50280 [Candidatus Entotheonella serta]|nr:hypothetical protein C2W62_50280 [Candidatus Entotheonella serta]